MKTLRFNALPTGYLGHWTDRKRAIESERSRAKQNLENRLAFAKETAVATALTAIPLVQAEVHDESSIHRDPDATTAVPGWMRSMPQHLLRKIDFPASKQAMPP